MKKNRIGETAVAFGIVFIFVFGAFAPAVGSVGKNGEYVTSSSVFRNGGEVSSTDFISLNYDTLLNRYLQTIIVGVISVAVSSPLLNQVREFFTGQEKSNDVGAKDNSVNPIDAADQTSQEQNSIEIINTCDPLPLDRGDSWWNTSWQYRKEIVVNHSKVAGDLTNFPVLFQITSSDFVNHAQLDGDDFVFIADDNITVLNHEIERYDSGTGELIAWVNVTNLSSTVDITFWLYYGNSGCISQENPESVWDAQYLGVWHLDETSGTIYDSTSNNNDGTEYIDPDSNLDTAGQINGGDLFDGSDYIDVDETDFKTLTEGTISIWAKGTTGTNQMLVMGDSDASSYYAFGANQDTGAIKRYGLRYSKSASDVLEFDCPVAIEDNIWHHYVFVINASGNKLFMDGVQQTLHYDDGSAASTAFFNHNSANDSTYA